MKKSRRSFLKTAVVGTAAAAITPGSSVAADSIQDPTVKARTGPFGEGLPISIAGYDYSRVRALVEGNVTAEGCAHSFDVTGIGPLNNHAFFGPQTRDGTEIGLIPYILAYCNDNFRDYTLLPIPVLRLFRHKSIFIRTDRGIRMPAPLRMKRLAVISTTKGFPRARWRSRKCSRSRLANSQRASACVSNRINRGGYSDCRSPCD